MTMPAKKTYKRNHRRKPARKKRHHGKGKGHRSKLLVAALLVGFYVLYRIISYLSEQLTLLFRNPGGLDVFGWLVIALLFIMSIGTIVRLYVKLKKYRQEKRRYLRSIYYKETNVPYRTMKKELGKAFEYVVSNALEHFSPGSEQWINPVFRRKNAMNEYAEIDIILFHPTGIFIIECKDFSGYVYGKVQDRFWTVGYENAGATKTYEFQNPIAQNKQHIKDLKGHHDAAYKNIVIFSDKTTVDTDITGLTTLNALKDTLSNADAIYDKEDLDRIKHALKEARADARREDHVRRIAFNASKY